MPKRSEKVCCRLGYDFSVRLEEAAQATRRSKSELMRDALEREVVRSLDEARVVAQAQPTI